MARNALQNERELNKAYKKFMELSTDDIGVTIEKVGFKFFGLLIEGTPRDTGRARNGWIPIVDRSAPSEWKPPQGQGHYGLNSFPLGVIKFNSIVWISNNVEYIQVLDEGHSKLQAPYGFTNSALRRTTIYIERQIERINNRRYPNVWWNCSKHCWNKDSR